MSINYQKIQEYLYAGKKTFLRIAVGLSIGFFICTTELNAACSSFQKTSIETSTVSSATESVRTSSHIEIKLRDNVEPREEKIDFAYNLNVATEKQEAYTLIFKRLSKNLKNIPFQRVTADIDDESRSLEFIFLFDSNLVLSVSKSLETANDNNAIASFFFNRKLIYSNVVNLSALPKHIISIEKKLQEA